MRRPSKLVNCSLATFTALASDSCIPQLCPQDSQSTLETQQTSSQNNYLILEDNTHVWYALSSNTIPPKLQGIISPKSFFLIHSIGSDHLPFEPYKKSLLGFGEGINIISYDRPNHGLSDSYKTGVASIEREVETLQKLTAKTPAYYSSQTLFTHGTDAALVAIEYAKQSSQKEINLLYSIVLIDPHYNPSNINLSKEIEKYSSTNLEKIGLIVYGSNASEESKQIISLLEQKLSSFESQFHPIIPITNANSSLDSNTKEKIATLLQNKIFFLPFDY